MPDFGINPQRFAPPIEAPTVPVNLGQPSAHAPVLPAFEGNWANLLPRAPSAGDMISAAELQAKLGIQRRQDAGYNAMAQLYQDPKNVDPNGMLKPEALRMLAAGGYPKEMMTAIGVQSEMAKSQAEIARSKILTQESAQKFLNDQQTRLLTDFEPLVAEYDDKVKTLGPERARQVVQQHYTELVEKAKTSGNYAPQILERINPAFDPERLRTNILGLKATQDREDKQSEFQLATDAGKGVQYRVYKDGRTTDITGKAPYTPSGVAETKGAEAKLLNVKTADGKERLARISPMGGFVDANTGEKIERVVTARNVGTKEDEGQYGKVSQIAIEDSESPGNTKIIPAQQDKKTGQWVTADANREPLPTPKRIVSTGGSGRQAEAQTMAMINAGNEATGSLKNLVELPIGATSGWFKGLTTQTPETLSAAIGRGVAGYVNDNDARSLQISWQGIGRSMATLEAAGRATGLVGLQKQAESLQPQKGDSYTNVLRSYAEIRQIIERSIETIKTSPGVSSDQNKLLSKIEGEAKATVPWTVHDVNTLETGGKDSVLEFAKKVHAGAAAEPKKPLPGGDKPAGEPKNNPAATGKMSPAPEGIYALKPGEDWKSLPPNSRFRLPDDPPDKMRIRP